MGWTNATAQAIQDDQFGVTARTAPTTPMKLAIETTAGTYSAAGTELGSTARQTITMGASTQSTNVVTSANSAAVSMTAGASGTVVATAIWDSAATPVRKSHGPLGTSRAVNAGDTLAFAVGAVTFSSTDTP